MSRVKSGATARARSTNNATASSPRSRSPSDGTGHSRSSSSRRPSRLVASTFTGPGRARIASTSSAAASRTCSQLSSTSRDRRPASVSAMLAVIVRPAFGTSPTVVATASATASGSPTAASSTSHTPSGILRHHLGRRPAPRGGSCPPRRRRSSVTSRASAKRVLHRRELRVAAHERRALRRQVRDEGVERPQRRERTLEVHVDNLEDPLRLAQVLEPVLAQVEYLDRCRRAPAPAAASDITIWPPCATAMIRAGSVHRRPVVVTVAQLRVTAVDPHAHPQRRRQLATLRLRSHVAPRLPRRFRPTRSRTTACAPSPVFFTTWPSWATIASRRISSWRASAGAHLTRAAPPTDVSNLRCR